MALPVANPYYYERGLRKIERTPKDVAATPSNEELTLSYVAAKSAEEERVKGVAGRLSLKEKWLDEQAREHGQEMALARDTLSSAGTQNRRATFLSLANVGLEGAGGYLKLQEVKKQEKMYEQFIEERRGLLKAQQDAFSVVKDLIQKNIDIWRGAYS